MEWENNEERSACCWNNTKRNEEFSRRIINIIVISHRNYETQVFKHIIIRVVSMIYWIFFRRLALHPLQTSET